MYETPVEEAARRLMASYAELAQLTDNHGERFAWNGNGLGGERWVDEDHLPGEDVALAVVTVGFDSMTLERATRLIEHCRRDKPASGERWAVWSRAANAVVIPPDGPEGVLWTSTLAELARKRLATVGDGRFGAWEHGLDDLYVAPVVQQVA